MKASSTDWLRTSLHVTAHEKIGYLYLHRAWLWKKKGWEWKLIGKSINGFQRELFHFVKNQMIDTHKRFPFGCRRAYYVNGNLVRRTHAKKKRRAPQFAWWSFQYWLLIITVFHPRLRLRDSATKAAGTKCQRILGKQSKAFEWMRRGEVRGNPHPNLLAFYPAGAQSASPPLTPHPLHPHPRAVGTSFPVLICLFVWFFCLSATMKVRRIIPPPTSWKHEQKF